ncbi:MAG TPA: endonuclease III [Gaiellales bacterium]|jgi:endonuclease-3|nr:endonuclease III [Gaiellales bacterium]
MSRLTPASPPERRVRAILLRLRKEYPGARTSLDFSTPWELLVATILSAQSTDVRVNMVTPELFRRYPDPQAFADADEGEIAKAIFQTGFHNQKARALRGTALAVLKRHGGRVPRSTEQLVRLPGVGRKTAAVVSGNAFGRREGIAVDTHVGRLSRRLGLTSETDPEKAERDLMQIVPRSAWVEWSHLLIYHGRAVCISRSPRCPECVLLDLCPEGQERVGHTSPSGRSS